MKNLWFLLFFAGLTPAFVSAQKSSLTTPSLDFGDIGADDQRYGDVRLTNFGEKKVYVLRIEQSPEIVYQLNSESIQPDSTLVVRVQVNPKKEGKFDYVVRIYMSDQNEPVLLKITGNVTELPRDRTLASQKCPDFHSVPAQLKPAELTIITVDAESGDRLSKSTVTIIRNGNPAGAWITGRDGNFKQDFKSGYFYFFASHDGYFAKEAGVFIGPEIREVTIPLKKDPAICPPVPQEQQKEETEAEEMADAAQEVPAEEVAQLLEQQLDNQQSDSVIRRELPELGTIPTDNFEAAYFKPVNVVFVLDISGSMKQGEKLDLMKYALNQLVGTLRPEDHISLVTYAEKAEVLLSPTTCDNKAAIREQVDLLGAEGTTAGSKGIKLGYKQALAQYSTDRANLVVIITDGAFNQDSDDYRKTVEKYVPQGIAFSVVGIKATSKDELKMQEASKIGNGRYIPIRKLADAQHNLVQEIRIASFRK